MSRVLGRVVLGIGLFGSHAWAQASGSFPEEPAAPAPAPPPAPSTAPAPAATAPAAEPPPAAAPAPEAPPAPPPAVDEPKPRARPVKVYEPEPPEPPKPVDGRVASITFSPLHLLVGPIAELQVEAQLFPHFGAALLGGFGTITVEDSYNGKTDLTAYELGGQLVGYPMDDFKSLQLGAEVLWVKVSTEEINGQEIRGDASGIAFGPFVGYKLITKAGFTFFAQGGFQYLTARGKASDENGTTGSDQDSQFIPLLNLNVGWSF